MRTLALALVLWSVLAAPRVAYGGGELSFGVATGGHVFADDLELGVVDAADQGAPASGVLVGARLGVRVAAWLSLEGELVLIPTTERMTGESIDVLGYRAQAAADVVRSGALRGFLVAGAGVLDLAASGVPTMEDDTDLALHWGAGLGVAVSRHIEVRLDGRHLVLPNITESGGSSDFELTAGLSYVFGVEAESAPASAPVSARSSPPVTTSARPPSDVDRDGLVDPVDECPRQPETLNGLDDDDGCPDVVAPPAR